MSVSVEFLTDEVNNNTAMSDLSVGRPPSHSYNGCVFLMAQVWNIFLWEVVFLFFKGGTFHSR